ncbi:MAG: NUDIX hydrolase [Pirellulaceae bacterium]|nr:NUDIX hydrolase [Pirellulaceae bacterium]
MTKQIGLGSITQQMLRYRYAPRYSAATCWEFMMKSHGPWKIVDSEEMYRDPWVSLRKDNVIRPDGNAGTYSIVAIKPGVSVLAMDDNQNVYLTEEFHYAVGRVTLETVSGGIEPDAGPLETAKRELREELGIGATSWRSLGECDPFTANLVSPTTLFVARGLTFGECDPEGTELIRKVKMSLAQAVEKVMQCEITHAPSCLLILKAARLAA